MKIFVIEDDKTLKRELMELLNKYGYETETSDNYQNIIEDIIENKTELIILDINLPYYDGFYICREIIFENLTVEKKLSRMHNDMDEIVSMNLGTDDYITKPYNMQILLGHISAVLKRTKNANYLDCIEV